MVRHKRSIILKPGNRLIEILHIDTSESRKLYQNIPLNPEEKARVQHLLFSQFRKCCINNGGVLRHWAGDGGFAFFLSAESFGAAIDAGKEFLDNLSNLNAQTARALDQKKFFRSVRIKAHRGEIHITKNASLDSADPFCFDDFVKFEKQFAPETDELFITEELYKAIGLGKKKKFQEFKKIKAGSISTILYRMKTEPVEKTHDIFKVGDELNAITDKEWNYLRSQIVHHKMNVAARNEITKGLVNTVRQNENVKNPISSKDLLELTFDSLYSYLALAFEPLQFRISYWRHVTKSGKDYVAMVTHRYPPGFEPSIPNRQLLVDDKRYQVCSSFKKKQILVTPCVVAARRAKEWFDFASSQKRKNRGLSSSIQVPIYYRDENDDKIGQGVLCIDTNKSDIFLAEEIELWREELVGYLVNISLSEMLHHCGV
jgi:hypothetical protein